MRRVSHLRLQSDASILHGSGDGVHRRCDDGYDDGDVMSRQRLRVRRHGLGFHRNCLQRLQILQRSIWRLFLVHLRLERDVSLQRGHKVVRVGCLKARIPRLHYSSCSQHLTQLMQVLHLLRWS